MDVLVEAAGPGREQELGLTGRQSGRGHILTSLRARDISTRVVRVLTTGFRSRVNGSELSNGAQMPRRERPQPAPTVSPRGPPPARPKRDESGRRVDPGLGFRLNRAQVPGGGGPGLPAEQGPAGEQRGLAERQARRARIGCRTGPRGC